MTNVDIFCSKNVRKNSLSLETESIKQNMALNKIYLILFQLAFYAK